MKKRNENDEGYEGISFGVGLVVGVGLTSALFFASVGGRNPSELYKTGDLNNDGVKDQVIRTVAGRKIPMYGIENEDGSVTYHTGNEIRQRALNESNARIPDYDRLERELNKAE